MTTAKENEFAYFLQQKESLTSHTQKLFKTQASNVLNWRWHQSHQVGNQVAFADIDFKHATDKIKHAEKTAKHGFIVDSLEPHAWVYPRNGTHGCTPETGRMGPMRPMHTWAHAGGFGGIGFR